MGLHLCLFQTLKVISFQRYTQFQSFNPIIEGFPKVFFGYTSKEVKCGGTQLFAGGIFSASKIFLETREKKKVTGGYIRRNRVDVLENSHPVLSKKMSHFWPCDLRRCLVTNKYHRYPSSVGIFW